MQCSRARCHQTHRDSTICRKPGEKFFRFSIEFICRRPKHFHFVPIIFAWHLISLFLFQGCDISGGTGRGQIHRVCPRQEQMEVSQLRTPLFNVIVFLFVIFFRPRFYVIYSEETNFILSFQFLQCVPPHQTKAQPEASPNAAAATTTTDARSYNVGFWQPRVKMSVV